MISRALTRATVGSVVVLISFLVSAGEPPISYPVDAAQAEYERKAAEIDKQCKAQQKNIVKRMDCEDVGRQQLYKTTPPRGAIYANAHYPKMSLEELETQWMELRPKRWVARSRNEFNSANPKPLGELTKEDIEAEMDVIERQRFLRNGTYFDPELKMSPEELEARKGDGSYLRKKQESGAAERNEKRSLKDLLKPQ